MANKKIVESLYYSLARGDIEVTTALLANDVDWWFHGPRRCQYMQRLLTGEVGPVDFRFVPRRVVEVGEGRWVVAEGWEGDQAYWVHAWAIDDGVITRFREYFNTSVTVRQVGRAIGTGVADRGRDAAHEIWHSQAGGSMGRAMPGLVLAI
ncbi:senescence associated gene 20 [Typha latifolia]|uniref:senescence associated gene 20 n=1 Tax=Typha latifolia TaxID=4733 RepID=UPI003C2B5DB0